MKSLLTLAIILSSASVYAARARTTALGNAAHLTGVFSKPTDMFSTADSLLIESGDAGVGAAATANATTGAEALLVRSQGDAKWALALGHDDAQIYKQRSAANGVAGVTTVIGQQNPFELSYGMKSGDMAWAGTLSYSNFNDKKAEVKENSMGLKLGAATSVWDATIGLGLADKWEDALNKDEYKGKSSISLKGGYWLASDMYVHANIAMAGYEVTNNASADSEIKTSDYQVGVINTVKSDGNEFFYGAGLASTESKESKGAETKITSMKLPFIIGVEANAASWLTLRGSITQNVLIQDEKTTNNTPTPTQDLSPGANSTAFAAGAGLKLGKLALDGSLLTAPSQALNAGAGNLLGTVGLTYTF